MELSSHHHMNLLEEAIMAPKIDTPYLNEVYFPNTAWAFDQTPDLHFPATNASLLGLISPPDFPNPPPFGEFHPFLDILTSPDFAFFYDKDDLPPMSNPLLDSVNIFEDGGSYKVESSEIGVHQNMDIFNVDLYGDKRSKAKKPDGLPSKNLMAERRRRKRLNDRLSMLRSIVPKISKMDRTSILGDTIDYMRELLDKIHKLREEGIDENINKINPSTGSNCLKELKPNEMVVRNPPKFDVARRNKDTRVEVCCTAKPGLLLSTLTTLDALGLDVQQCVISCFNDFSLQASCFEGGENESVLSCEDMKQALFRNAGYGGRCL